MKKLLSLVLLLALSVTLFVGCTNQPTEPTDPTAPQSFLESAKTLLFNEYKPASKDEVPEKKKDFALLTNVMAGGDNHSVVWTVTVTSGDPEAVKIVDNAKVDVPENSSVEILFTLNATISDPYGNSANLSFNFKVPVYVPSSLSVVDPVAGEAYKMGMVQGNLDDTLYYFAGGKSGTYYLGTSENEADALDVYLETTEGGYYLYYMENDAKVYINHVISGTHVNGTYEATPSTVYTYDAELRTITIKVQAEDDAEPVVYLLGTRSTKNNTDLGFYKLSDNPFYVKFYGFDPNACVHTGGTPSCTQKAVCDLCGEEYGVKLDHEYDATTHLCICGAHDPSVTVTLTIPEALATPDGQNVVVSGTVSSIYQAYSPDFNNISVYITDGNGNTLYVYRLTGEVSVGDIITVTGTMASYNGSKQIAQGGTFVKTGHDNSYDYVNMTIPEVLAAEDGVNVIVSGTVVEINGEWDSNYKNMNVTIADANGNKLYVYRTSTQVTLGDIITVKGSVGSYNGAKQIAQGSTATIDGHDDSVGSGTTEPSEPSTPSVNLGVVDLPAAGVAYKFGMVQPNLSTTDVYYISGGMAATYYLATNKDVSNALDVYLEETTGGYYMYAMVNGVKTYINAVVSGTHVNAKYQDAPATVYTFDAELKTVKFPATVEGEDGWYIFGNKNGTTYTTIGCYNLTGNPYYCQFYAEGTDEPGSNVPDDDDTTTAPSVETTAPSSSVMSIPEVLASAEGTSVVVKGTVSEIYQSWSDQYGNISFYISDEAGNKLLVFRTGTKVAIGDKVTVTGKATVYNGTIQIAQGGVTVIDEKHVCSTFTEGSCTVDSFCTVCGTLKTAAIGHIYVDGACSACGATEPVGDVLPGNLSFTDAVSKASADSYMKENFPEWKITGKLGQTYDGYLGFGRSGDNSSAITSSAISVSNKFTVTAVIRGNGSSGVMTSTLTFTLVDSTGATIATGYADGSTTAAITPADAKDTTYNISFTFVDGKTWNDVSNLVVSFAKTTGNIGLKSLNFVQ